MADRDRSVFARGSRVEGRGSRVESSPLIAARAIACLSAVAWLCTAAVVRDGSASPPEGISHYELVVLGSEFESDQFNMAYEITDCGLIVGQMRRIVSGLPDPVRQAFVYSTRTRPGLPAGTVVFLPSAAEPGTPSIARDVNDDGWIVGDFGEESPNINSALRRAVAWRVASDGTMTARTVHPPDDPDFLSYGSQGYGWLAAVSTGGAPWVAANFSLVDNCGLGGTSLRRERVAAVELFDTPTPLSYRVLATEACPEPDVTDEGRHHARAVSASGDWLAGSRQTCGYATDCHEPVGLKSRMWLRDLEACGTATQGLECVACLTPNPVSAGSYLGGAIQAAILDDRSSAGTVFDNWPELVGNQPACGGRAYVWDPYDPCDWEHELGPRRRECSDATTPPPSLGAALPLPAGQSVKRSDAFDFERSAFVTQGVVAGHFVVGSVNYNDFEFDPEPRGHLWSAPLGALGTVEGVTWTGASASSLISPITPGFDQVTVRELRGVNRRGDLTGTAEFYTELPSPTFRHRAVFLRAIPIRCVGDLNHDGVVGAADLAILLGAWCSTGGATCQAVADLNIDGAVGSTDLALLLGNWGDTPCAGACAPDATEVPPEPAEESKEAVEFSIAYVGLTDIAGYRAWAATAPAELRELVEGIMWQVAKGGVQ